MTKVHITSYSYFYRKLYILLIINNVIAIYHPPFHFFSETSRQMKAFLRGTEVKVAKKASREPNISFINLFIK